jgi:hypothetical protein
MSENRTGYRTWSLVAVGAAALLPFAASCGSKSPPPPQTGQNPAGAGSYPPGAYSGAPGSTAPAPGPGPSGPQPTGSQTPAPLAPTDPNSLQGILQGLLGAVPGTLVGPGGLGGDVAEVGMKAEAARVAPGMQPEGSELKQTLNEGQHAVMLVTMQAGKCYTLVGFSPLGAVRDLDLNLLTPPFYTTLAGQDLTHNNSPAIGSSPNPMCPVIPLALQYKLDVLARAGSGPIAVQLYSKTK